MLNILSEISAKPDIYECHGHIMMGGDPRAAFKALKDAGVTYFRDGGDAKGESVLQRGLASEYGIEYATPVFAIHKAGRYGKIVGRAFEDMDGYIALVREAKLAGADFIKVMYSGIITFREYGQLSCPPLMEEEMREMVSVAHGEGLAVMAHTNGAETIASAARAGTDSIEHGAFADEESLKAMADAGCFWVPTIAAIGAFYKREGFDEDIAKRTLDAHLASVARGFELGIRIACGSDAGAFHTPYGEAALTEEKYLLSCGADPEILRENNRLLAEKFRR